MSIIDLSQPTLLTTTSVVNFGLAFLAIAIGAIVYLRDRKSTVNQLFLMIALNLGFWTFSSTMADVSREYSSALFWARAAFVGPLFFAPFFLLFSYYFPKRSGDVSLTKILLIFAPCAIATVFVPTPANIVSIALMDWGTDFTPGPLYIYLFAYMTICSALAARHFYIVYKKTDDAMVKKQITMAFLGLALVVASGLVTNLVLPVIFKYSRASVIGPAASLFFVVLIMYAILRHGLLNTKVIAAEIFSGALVFLSFVDVFTAGSVGQYLYRGVVFLITLLIALLLVKSVTAEVRRREELHELSQKLAVANEHLKEMDQLKSEFISIASHQLRTPISVVKGYISLMLEGAYGKVEGPLKEKLENMNMMNERLVQMINNMLNVSRIEKNKIEYICTMVPVKPVIEQAVVEMSFKAKQKGLALTFDAAGSEDLAVYVDAEKFHEVLTNLVDNAIKYTERGSITLRAKKLPKGKGAIIHVEDQGIGMNKETAAGVFQKFYRSNDPAVKRESGSGLGLYIVAIFVRSMGGDVWIEKTAPGRGTTVAVTLPVDPKNVCTRESMKKA